MDAISILKNDHEALRRLFRTLTESPDRDGARQLFRTLCRTIEAHVRAEEDVFYPAVMRVRVNEAKQAVRLALEAHQALDGLLAEIGALDPDDVRFAERLAALRQSVERHIEDDQSTMFNLACIHLTDERLEALGRAMEQLQETDAQFPNPSPPEPVGASSPHPPRPGN